MGRENSTWTLKIKMQSPKKETPPKKQIQFEHFGASERGFIKATTTKFCNSGKKLISEWQLLAKISKKKNRNDRTKTKRTEN